MAEIDWSSETHGHANRLIEKPSLQVPGVAKSDHDGVSLVWVSDEDWQRVYNRLGEENVRVFCTSARYYGERDIAIMLVQSADLQKLTAIITVPG